MFGVSDGCGLESVGLVEKSSVFAMVGDGGPERLTGCCIGTDIGAVRAVLGAEVSYY